MKMFAFLSQKRILGGAFVLAALQASASLAGLIRDRVLAGTFPDLNVVDVYIAAFRPSDLFYQMTVMAGISVAMVPLLASYYAKKNKQEMVSLLSSAISVFGCIFGLVALVLSIVFPVVAPYLVHFEGEALDLYISFGRIALLTNFLFVFGNAFGGYLLTIQRYWIYGVTPVLYTVGTIAGTIWLTPIFGAHGPIYGTLGGAIVFAVLRGISVVVHASIRPAHFCLWHTDVVEIFQLMLPRVLALGALQLELLIFDTIGSGLGSGAVTINAYARNFQAVVVGVAGIALAQSAYSLLSQSYAQGNAKRFWIYVRKGVLFICLLTIPASIVLTLLAPVAAWLVNLLHVLPVFAVCLAFYCISIPFESINHLLLRGFYATKHTVTPAMLSVLNGAIAIAVSWNLAPSIGVYALAIGFSAGQIVQMIGLSVLLPRRVQ
jgi:putative peptidoglycan lipid II flippase